MFETGMTDARQERVRRQLVADNAPWTACRRFAMFQAVAQPGIGCDATRNAEQLKSWEHQVEIHEKVAGI